MTEKEKTIRADATGGCSIDAALALGVPAHGTMGIRYGYSVMPVGFLVIVAFALGAAAYRLYKWFNNWALR